MDSKRLAFLEEEPLCRNWPASELLQALRDANTKIAELDAEVSETRCMWVQRERMYTRQLAAVGALQQKWKSGVISGQEAMIELNALAGEEDDD